MNLSDLDRNHVAATPGKRPSLLPYLLLALIAFLLGLAVMAWLLARWDTAAHYLGVTPEPSAPVALDRSVGDAPPAGPVPASPAQGEAAAAQNSELQRRVSQLEQRVSQINVQAQAALGNSGRAEGLLVAFAARRALDRGVPLGYLESLLRQRFGTSEPRAVATVIAAARQPVTLEELRDGLEEVGPQLTGAAPDQNWWDALRTQFGELITIRQKGTPSTVPADRLRRAQQRLEAGQVDVALAEVLRLPGRENAREWIAAARRYVAARRALDTIETAALLDPQTVPQPVRVQPAAEPAEEPDAEAADAAAPVTAPPTS